MSKAMSDVLALLERSLDVIQHDIDEIGGCDHSVGVCCCELIHLADDIRAMLDAAPKPPAAQDRGEVKSLREMLGELRRARRVAMEWAMKARIPECAEFAGIAQDLDFVLTAMDDLAAHTDPNVCYGDGFYDGYWKGRGEGWDAAMAAQNPDDALDAKRYRWLRKNWQFSLHGKPVWLELDADIADIDSTDKLDAAIDAAMERTK